MPTIAAIIPLYNGEHYIKEALASVFAQDRAADEIIVVDDGSSDGGPQIVENMLQHEKRLRFFRKSNGGQGSARNFGVANTSCDLIAFLDQDDYWYNNHLSVLEQLFLSKDDGNLGYVYSNPDRVGVNGNMLIPQFLNTLKHQEHPKKSVLSCLARDMYVLPGSSLISRKLFLDIGGFDECFRGCEDDDLFIRMFCAGYSSEYTELSLYAWRNNPSSTSFSRAMIISREAYFDKISNGGIKELSKHEKTVFSHRCARLSSQGIKSAIARNDRDTLDLLVMQTMKFSAAMDPSPRFFLRFKVLRRYWAARLRSIVEAMIGIKRQSRPLPASPE